MGNGEAPTNLAAPADALRVVRVPGWDHLEWLRHGFSTRLGGLSTVYGGHDLNLGYTRDDDPEVVAANRALFLQAVAGDEPARLVAVRQVHGTRVQAVTAETAGPATDADGMMTSARGVMLGIQAADCVPVLLADTRRRVVAAIHAGWRGTAARIVEQGIAAMAAEYGSAPEDLMGAVGPSIGPCCYAIGEEVRERFSSEFAYATELFSRREDGLHLNLWASNRRQMEIAGLRPENVAVLGECTACARFDSHRKYFSHRAERGFTGRAMGIIGIATPGIIG